MCTVSAIPLADSGFRLVCNRDELDTRPVAAADHEMAAFPRKSEQNLTTHDPHFALLGAEPHESLESIKKKYRELAKKWHPDRLTAAGASLRGGGPAIACKIEPLSNEHFGTCPMLSWGRLR